MADESVLSIVISAQDKAGAVLKSVQEEIKGMQGKVDTLKPAFKAMAVAGTVAFAAVSAAILTSVSAYGEAEVQMSKVNATLGNMKVDVGKAREEIIKASKATVQLGFDDEDAAVSITKFYQRTNDLSEAIKLNNLAMDLARAKSIDLTTATQLINLALSGSGRALLSYGIVIKDMATPLEALATLQGYVGGQAVSFTKTYVGQTAILGAKITNLREAIGAPFAKALTGVFEKLQPIIDKFVKWADENPILIKTIGILSLALAGLTAAIGTAGLAILAFTPKVAAMIYTVTTALGPIALITVALSILTALIMTKFVGSIEAQTNAINDASKKLEDLTLSYKNLKVPIEADAATMQDFADKVKEANKDIESAKKSLNDLIKESNDQQIKYNEEKAQIFIDQEQKIADMTAEIATKKAEMVSSIEELIATQKKQTDENTTEAEKTEMAKQLVDKQTALNLEIANLEANLSKENTAYDAHKAEQETMTTDLTEMRRRAGLTEFDNKLEQLNRERAEESLRQTERIAEAEAQLLLAQDVKNKLIAQEQEYTKKLKLENDTRIASLKEVENQMKMTLSQIQTLNSTPVTNPATGWESFKKWFGGTFDFSALGFAEGGIVPGTIGKPVPAIVHGGERIIPAGKSGGINITITGNTFMSDEEAAEKIGDRIIRILKMQNRFAY